MNTPTIEHPSGELVGLTIVVEVDGRALQVIEATTRRISLTHGASLRLCIVPVMEPPSGGDIEGNRP